MWGSHDPSFSIQLCEVVIGTLALENEFLVVSSPIEKVAKSRNY